MRAIGVIVGVSIAVSASAPPAHAWGQNGHRIIGAIAQDKISGKTRAEIARTLGSEGLAEASTWADDERSNPTTFWQKEAGPYHYVTVPKGMEYDDVGAPSEGDAVSALKRFTATVRDPSASPEEKALALRFIIHIVGDLHQPLHAGNGEDRGGNDIDVRWFGEQTNLHSVWDTKMIEGQNLSYSEYANWLDAKLTPELVVEWWQPDVLMWVAESAAIRDRLYPGVETAPNLGWSYQYQHLGTVERRLQQGGVRLAAYLDDLFR
ncbi:S1/P1 nuclease [Sphingomicrobium sp. XHP0235]|uniref:S1/P1 nuclease n=1 Tax=Sphingomicrobium aquimarinum TaxID=3133971 RepID=UPI0031FF16C2